MKKNFFWGVMSAVFVLAFIACGDDPAGDVSEFGAGGSGINISFGDDTFSLNRDTTTPLSQVEDDSITITLSKTFVSVRWIINGEQKNNLDNQTAITLNAAGLQPGNYSVTAMVWDGISWYSRTVSFTVGL